MILEEWIEHKWLELNSAICDLNGLGVFEAYKISDGKVVVISTPVLTMDEMFDVAEMTLVEEDGQWRLNRFEFTDVAKHHYRMGAEDDRGSQDLSVIDGTGV